MKSFKQFLYEGPRDPQLGHIYDDNFLHHTTPTKNLSDIQDQGLVGGRDSTFDGYSGNNDKVHLSPTLDSAEYWNGMVNNIAGDTTLLRVPRHAVNIEPSYRRDEVLTTRVDPEHIEYHDGNTWKPLR